MFWVGVTVGRMSGIPLSIMFRPRTLLWANIVICFLSLIVWLIFFGNGVVLWIVTFTYGVGMGSTFPFALTYAETYVTLTGKISTLFILCSAIGEMAIPAIVLNLLDANVIWLPVILLFAGILGLIVFVVAIFVSRKTQKSNLNIPSHEHPTVFYHHDHEEIQQKEQNKFEVTELEEQTTKLTENETNEEEDK